MKKFLLLSVCVGCLATMVAAQGPTVKAETHLRGDTDEAPISMPLPEYPAPALESALNGSVSVSITVDQAGNVITAKATRGPGPICEGVTDPPILALRQAATEAALKAKFPPPRSGGQPAEVNGWIYYNFQSNRKGPDLKMGGL